MALAALNSQTWTLPQQIDGKLYMTPPSFTFPTDQELRDYGYILAKDYGAVGNGTTDDSDAIQAAILDSLAIHQPVYLHYTDAGYMINKPLYMIEVASISAPPGGESYDSAQLIGGLDPATYSKKTRIFLGPSASPFNNTSQLCPVLTLGAVSPDQNGNTTPYVQNDNPLVLPNDWQWAIGNCYGLYISNLELDTSGYAGAMGLCFQGAQYCIMDKIKVIATGSGIGIGSFPATNFPSLDIEVVGGAVSCQFQYSATGISTNTGAGENVIGLKITCEPGGVPFESGRISTPATVTGFEVLNCDGLVHQVAGDSDGNTSNWSGNGLMLSDGRIEITGGGNPTAFTNPDGYNGWLNNVYITGTTNLISNQGSVTQTGSSGWNRIKRYCANSVYNVLNYPYRIRTESMVDGVVTNYTTPEVGVSIDTNATDPTSAIRTRHIITLPRVDDGLPFVDAVADYGADETNNSASDSRAAIQAALDNNDRVFLRRGKYYIGRGAGDYSLRLNAGNKLFGIYPGNKGETWAPNYPTHGTFMMPTQDYLDTVFSENFMVSTEASTTAEVALVNIGLWLPYGDSAAPAGGSNREVAPAHEWFSGLNAKCYAEQFGVTTHCQFLYSAIGRYNTNPRRALLVDSTGGGKFYGFNTNNGRWGNRLCTGVTVNGPNTQPVLVYGANFEMTKGGSNIYSQECAYKIEVNNASNVLIVSCKHEGRSASMIVTDSSNVGFIGDGVADQVRNPMFQFLGNSNNNIVFGSVIRNSGSGDPEVRVYENLDGEPAVSTGPIEEADLGLYSRGDFDMEAFFLPDTYAAYPVVPGGVLDRPDVTITNPNATWAVTSETDLGGTFTYGAGGVWAYTRGAGTGTASFSWSLFDYDGLGSNTSSTHSFSVL